MKKALDVNAIFAGAEPKVSGLITQSDLTKMLSWYAQNRVAKDAIKYATDYFKKKLKLDVPDTIKGQPSTFGFVCRIVANGGVLSDKNQEWFDTTIEELKKHSNKVIEKKTTTNVLSIQDHIKRKAGECIAELEGQIDDLIISRFSNNVAPNATFMSHEVKGAHVKFIIDHFKARRTEYDTVLTTTDAELKEAYSNFTKPQLKKLIAYCDQVIVEAMKLSDTATKSRKPRKRKTKTAEQLVGKMQYAKDFAELKLVSIDPKTIVGALTLWVYNTKTRKLGVYHAADAGGLSIKGSTLQNFTESKSIAKKLRKPEVTLPEILNGGKVYLRNAIDNIRAVESALTGRINADTILLKVSK